jgi:carbon-monoxide dehydrogenase small subunit
MLSVSMTINGRPVSAEVDERTLLLEFVRDVAQLTGAKNGCLEARCGCCTVRANGQAVKSCNVLAAQFDGAEITTVEGLAEGAEPVAGPNGGVVAALAPPPGLTVLQQAFHDHGAVQCGFCTPGMLMTLTDLLDRNPNPTEADVRRAISGNLCRCTGYQKIVDAALDAAERSHGVGVR